MLYKPVGKVEYTIKDGVTQSLLSMFMCCPQRTRMYLEGWRQRTTSDGLVMGTLTHKIREYYLEMKFNKDTNPFPELLVNQGEKFLKKGSKRGLTEKELMNIHVAAALVYGFFVAYPPKGAITSEVGFDVDAFGIRLRGKRDGLRTVKKGLWIEEFKTTQQVTEDMDTALNLDFQIQFYLAATTLEIGKKPSGVIYDIARKPSIRQKQTETSKDYYLRLLQDTEARPEFYFLSFEVKYTTKQIARFIEELEVWLCKYRKWCNEGFPPIRNYTQCRGCFQCDYADYCAHGRLDTLKKDGKLFEELEDDAS